VDLSTIIVTWRDGAVAAYEYATASVTNGTLHIALYDPRPGHRLLKTWHFPTSFIRAWGPEEWHADNAAGLGSNSVTNRDGASTGRA